ncbi:sigma-70 family RNA polymerase sigma factor [Acidothermaceae bacterium B102]|nr:sigma-70 family RNA polymerase sigma factor [Acidothermaceae bacterium B102]
MTDRRWPAEQLVLVAQGGDAASIAAVVSASHPHAQRFARSLCSSPEDAEDAAQEAVIILFRNVGSLRALGALASWLYQIVRHECLRRWRRAPLLTPVDDELTASAEEDVMSRLEVERVALAIAGLPPDLRRVLILRDVQGYSGRTVAESLGLSVSAMKSRLHRAREAVRAVLDESPPAAS